MFKFLKTLFNRNDYSDTPRVTPKPLEGFIMKGDFALNIAIARKLLEFNTTGQSGAMDCIWTYHINVSYYLSANNNLVEVIRDLDHGSEVTSIKKVEKQEVINQYGMILKFPLGYHLIYVDEKEIQWHPEVL